ncbi:transcriptional regulator family: Forkhead [Penicillium brevicompactum]|uniref:Transcriptional regulator family: Forkhead n=1 Tax=Penicillium brevicompactum TaxID=5074 RepID=A0A9W9QMY1_PENBR|nr:transcriptional regulator family: Forkhead [Penicillium brevicompactum]
MATDQREGPGALSGQTVPSSSVGSYQANLNPHHNPCNIDDWSRWVSQPLLVPSSPHSRFYPQMDAEYSMGLSHQNLGASNYTWINHHDIPPHVPGIDSPNMGPMGEIKDEYVDEDKSEWKTIRQSPIKEELYYSGMLPMQNLPPSPPSTSTSTDSSYPSPESGHAPSPERTGSGMNKEDTKERAGNLPYSILIYRALKSADGNKLSLQGIYRWFEMNTDKAKDPNHKGWQNSIRHNLSMNAGFEAVKEEMGPGQKTVNFWRLTPAAIQDGGIQSTTRYRKGSAKGTGRNSQREPTGSDGGHPPKKVKTSHAVNHSSSHISHIPHISHIQQYPQGYLPTELPPMAFLPHTFPSGLPPVNHPMPRFGLGPVSGCTAQFPGNNGVVLDYPEMGPDYGPTYPIGPTWYASSTLPNDRAIAGSNVPAGPVLGYKDQ